LVTTIIADGSGEPPVSVVAVVVTVTLVEGVTPVVVVRPGGGVTPAGLVPTP
jgi:hypothetical protein